LDKTVRVWDLAAGGEPLVLKGHESSVKSVTFSPDSRRLASGSADKTVRVWDLAAGGEPLVLKGHEEGLWSVSFSPDGRRLASGSLDKTVRVWDLAAGGEPLVLMGHGAPVLSVSFSPDGLRLVSGAFDTTVRVWDLAAGAEPLVLRGHQEPVLSVSFSPDGRRLASGSWDNTVRVWEWGCENLWRLRQATQEEMKSSWYSARFHLDWLLKEERERQAVEAANLLTSPTALDCAANFLALPSGEGRTSLADILARRQRARLELDDLDSAEEDFRLLRAMNEDTLTTWHRHAWGQLAKARQSRMLQVVTEVVGLGSATGSAPLAVTVTLWPRGTPNLVGFRKACEDMDRRFQDSKDAGAVHSIAWTRLLIGEALTYEEKHRLLELAKYASDAKPDSSAYRESYGAALFRAGKFQEAIDKLKISAEKSANAKTVSHQYFLAMAHHRLGHDEEARAWLTKAVRQIEAEKNPTWESRVVSYYLRLEAEATLAWRVPPSLREADR
jgi:tetratricopeptide (TPR) repeat protein